MEKFFLVNEKLPTHPSPSPLKSNGSPLNWVLQNIPYGLKLSTHVNLILTIKINKIILFFICSENQIAEMVKLRSALVCWNILKK